MSNEREDKVIITPLAPAKKSIRLSWVNIGILCSAFSIVVLIVAGAYSYWYFMTANLQLTALATQSQTQLQQLQDTVKEMQKNAEETQQTIQQFSAGIKNLTQTTTELAQTKQGNQEKWLLAEARYYVKLANDNLQFAHNIPLAISLLQMADQEIGATANPKLADVRRAIAADIVNLQGAAKVDVAGLYVKLVALNNQLDKLPLLTRQATASEQKPIASQDQQQTWWQRGLHTSWQALQSIVIVRYAPNGAVPLMTPDQQTFLYQNLHSLLLQTMWALLHKQSAIYQASLQQATEWIKRYFVADSSITQAVLDGLTQLEKVDVQPPVPTITHSLQAVNGV